MALVSLDQLGLEMEAALPAAVEAMELAKLWLSCRDQEKDLTATVEEVLHTLKGELSRERLEETAYIRSTAQRALIDVAVNVTFSLFSGSLQSTRREPEQAPPFGRVLVAVGPEGVPAGLRVINISSLARSGGTPEAVVEKGITAQGNFLLTQEAFRQLVDWLRTEVSAGRIGLPYHPHGANI